MTITLKSRWAYGRTLLYPIGPEAEHLRRLTGKKTVDLDDLRALRGLGIEVVAIPETASVFDGI
jgi:hypothetical protein|tara:strand:+ start:631 stop:822 length:192 start_codon:yes stop_codon:yes gene_type:complete